MVLNLGVPRFSTPRKEDVAAQVGLQVSFMAGMPRLRLMRGWDGNDTLSPGSPLRFFPLRSQEGNGPLPAVSEAKPRPEPASNSVAKETTLPGSARPSACNPRDSVPPQWFRRCPAPHPGDAFLAAQGRQHLGHVAHHARVLHAHQAPLAPQLHGDGDPGPRVGRPRGHPCPASPARRGPLPHALS